MIDKLYGEKIIHYAKHIARQERLEKPQVSVRKRSIFCGSEVEIDVNFEGDIVTAFGQEVNACALGSTTASIVGEHIIGASKDEILSAYEQMQQMLKDGETKIEGRFSELNILASVKDYPNRHKSCMLVLEALSDAVQNS